MSAANSRAGKRSPAGPELIAVSFQPAIPPQVAPQQGPPPLHRPTANSPLSHAGVNPSARQPLSPISCLTQGVQSAALTPFSRTPFSRWHWLGNREA